jgi:hypothetical protein
MDREASYTGGRGFANAEIHTEDQSRPDIPTMQRKRLPTSEPKQPAASCAVAEDGTQIPADGRVIVACTSMQRKDIQRLLFT